MDLEFSPNMSSQNVFIILSHPVTADNIGAAARAMKNMGFSKLRLISPRRNWKRRAVVLARRAEDVLASAEVYATLEEAVSDLNWTFGTTRRSREKTAKFIPFKRFIEMTQKKSAALKVGIVFGCETTGLTAHELGCCDQLVSIPSSEEYPSLNLAQAVMVTVFSFANANQTLASRGIGSKRKSEMVLDKKAVQETLAFFEDALKSLGFYGGKDGRLDKIIRISEALFKRAGMFPYEAQMLKGLSARIMERANQQK